MLGLFSMLSGVLRPFARHVVGLATTGWRQHSPWRQLFVLLLAGVLLHRLWWALTFLKEYDELLAYFYFGSRSPLHALAWYPEPNNHPLFSLLFFPGVWLLPEPLWAMRLPAVLADTLTCALLWGWTLRLSGRPWAALLAVLVWLGAFPVWAYGYQARGYPLAAALAVLMWSALWDPRIPRRVGVLAGALGLFTLPTFLYAWLAGWGVLLLRNLHPQPTLRSLLHQVGLPAAASLGLALLLYAPMLAVNGSRVVANPYILPLPVAEALALWPQYVYTLFWYLWDHPLLGPGLGLAGLAAAASGWRPFSPAALALPVLLALSALLLLPLPVLADHRHWLYCVLAVAIALAGAVSRCRWTGLAPAALLAAALLLANRWQEYPHRWDVDRAHARVREDVLERHLRQPARAQPGDSLYVYTNEGFMLYAAEYVIRRDGLRAAVHWHSAWDSTHSYHRLLVFDSGFRPTAPPPLHTYRLLERHAFGRVYGPKPTQP